MKIRIYHPHTHAGKRLNPGPNGVEIDVSPAALEFIRTRGLDVPPTTPAIGTEPQAGEGAERHGVPADGNRATSADRTTAPADPEADMPVGAGTAGTAAGGSVTVATDDPTVTRTVSPAGGAAGRSAGTDTTVTRNTTPPARTGKK